MGTVDEDATVEDRSATAPALDQLIAGRYRIRELLGRGGMASVYRAEDESLGRAVAIKIFHAGLAHAQDARRQQEETSLLAGFNHPALVTLFDAARDDHASFLVMELVDGTDLRLRMKSGPVDPRAVAQIGADVAGALAYIHEKNVVHRDVKPANILLPSTVDRSHPTHAKLADFGIARLIDSTHLTAAGSLIGTASYLSPEQAEGGAVGGSSDIYSLSLVLLECLTGERAFPGSAVESTVARLHRDPMIPATIGSDWATVLRAGTAREPSARPSADTLARQLRELADSEVTLVAPLSVTSAAGVGQSFEVDQSTAAMTQRTQVLAPTGTGDNDPRPRTLWHPRRTIAIIVGALVVAGALGLWAARPGQAGDATPSGTTTEVSYPAVDGDLGVHLEQLQDSVAP